MVNGTDINHLYFWGLDDAFDELFEEGSVVIYDSASPENPIEYFLINDKGFVCGQLCGGGTITYTLPDEKVFYSGDWIS